MTTEEIDCSVIVLTWQDFNLTRTCVESLGPHVETIVVDNGSDAAVAAELKNLCVEYGAKYVRSAVNLGFAGGMNLGLLQATRTVVVFSNNDIIADPDSVRNLARLATQPGVGAVFPAIRNASNEVVTAGGRYLTVSRALAHAFGITMLKCTKTSLKCSISDAEWYAGPFVVIPRILANSIGGVPPQSFMYSEDYRLCWVLSEMGLRCDLVNDVSVQHIDDATTSTVWNENKIASLQMTELLRAAIDGQRGWTRKRVLGYSYVFGTWLRSRIHRDPLREAVLIGATRGRDLGLRRATVADESDGQE